MATQLMTPAGIDSETRYSRLMTPNESPKEIKATSEETEDLVHTLKRMYDSAKRARRERESHWQSYWDFYDGKQWPQKRPTTKASPNCNVIRSVVNTVAPIMTDTSPSFGVLARDPADFKFSELMTDVLRVWWSRRSMNHVLVETMMDCLITDIGILKVTWDPDADDGVGDVMVTGCDPKNIYVPEQAEDFDRNCPWVIHEFFMTRGKLTLKFPGKRDEIKKADAYSKPIGPESSMDDTRVRVVSPVDKDMPGLETAPEGKSARDDIRVWEVWLDDDTVIEAEQISENGDKDIILKKKYPHGRMVTLMPDSKIILQDVENPYRDGEKPFVRLIDVLIPRSFYGSGEVQPLMESQKMINKVFSVILDWANLMANPCWIIDANSGVDPDMLTSQVGQIIVKQPNTTVERTDAPPVPPQLFELYHTLMQLVDQQSGVHEVTQGRKPTGITAASAIETLQEAAQTRIRLKERNLLVSLTKLGRMIVSRMLQFYTEPRVIRITGRGDLTNVWPPYVKFYVQQTDDKGGTTKYQPMTQPITYDESVGEYVEGQAELGAASMGDFELDVTTGTSLPFIKQQRSEQAIRLWENKAIDQKALLDILEMPEKDEILNRMQQQAAEQPAPGGAPQQPPVM